MVVDIKKLSDTLRQTSPEDDLRQDLERIIRARRGEINNALTAGHSFVLRVPDGRRIRISPKVAAAAAI
jgi:DNA integrity scanning protein DisA with diadenylate cyclase activity